MKQFAYTAINSRKAKVTGVVSAPNISVARSKIKSMRLRPSSIKPVSDSGEEDITPILGNIIYKDAHGIQIKLAPEKVSKKDVMRFTSQLSTLIYSGVPMLQSIDILRKQQKSKKFQQQLKTIHMQIQKGSSLSAALSNYPDIFDPLYIAITKSGEASGTLDTSLKYILSYMEKAQKLKSKIKSALTYPTIVIVIAIGILWGLITFVVPSIAENFGGKDELPELTRTVLDISNFTQTYMLETVIGVAAMIIAFGYWRKTPHGRMFLDHFIIRIPAVGDLVKKIIISRICNIISSMISSGVPLIEVINTCIICCDNKYMESVIKRTKTLVQEGHKLYEAFESTKAMPDLVISMISVGERSGKLDTMLVKVSEYYEDEVDATTSQVLQLIEPSLIVVIGGFIAIILIAMYLPMFDLAGTV